MRLLPATLRTAVLAAAIGLAAAPPAAAAGPAAQTIPLRPGWNAVWLEVQPEPNDPATVFAGLPVEAVWAWMERSTTMLYLQNPGEPAWDLAAWKGYRPLEPGYLTNLYGILANRAYLVKLGGAAAVDLVVTGTPAPLPPDWVPDSFNLRGFPVAEAAPPTFDAWFAPSPAHRGRVIYRLGGDGAWQFVDTPAATAIRRGEAYWVWCDGPSAYAGPLEVGGPVRGLDFGAGVDELELTVLDLAGAGRTVTVRQAAPGAPAAVVTREFDPVAKTFVWPALPLAIDLRAGGRRRVPLAVRRELLAAEPFAGVIEIDDGAGMLVRIPVSARRPE